MSVRPLRWEQDALFMLDQRLLPREERWLRFDDWECVREAIRTMAVRGAPAIGIAAAYGMALAARQGISREEADAGLRSSRPTAVNLFWALDRMRAVEPWTFDRALAEARSIEAEDLMMNLEIGERGAALVPPKAKILTICNTGGLATSGHGTALGIIRSAHAHDPSVFVYACETRPRLQGLRLTAWELLQDGIPFQVIPDGAAASVLRDQGVGLVVAGADRIAANGDTANKIGTYGLAVLARHHGVPFVIAAPSSTIDTSLATGAGIPIEHREAEEITHLEERPIAPEGCPVLNPAFDVTPGDLIDAIVTEAGVHRPPYCFDGAA